MPEVAKQCWVSGKVQGVFFRASTQKKAEALNLRGHAKNLPDGRVRVIVAGSNADVSAMIDWLHQGSLMARVDSVLVEDFKESVGPGFTTA